MAGGGVWAPYKELASVVNSAILNKQHDAYYALEAILTKHKPDFVSLLKNPPKNSRHRAQVQKATKDGIQIPGLPSVHILPQDFVEEALILSDILDLNELSAVELLLAGEQQLPRFPTLTRGLVAVLLYHDGRRSLVSALRTLIQAREGVAWTLGLNPALVNLVTSFTDQLFQDGLVEKILKLLESINVEKELEELSKGRAVGGEKHRQQIIDFIEEQRSLLADCLLFWATQNPFPKEDTLRLFHHVRQLRLETPKVTCAHSSGGQRLTGTFVLQQEEGTKKEAYKPLDVVSLTLFHSLVACFNIGELTVETAMDDSQLEDHYPLLNDLTFLPSIHEQLLKGPDQWSTPEMFAAVQFMWAVLLRECAGRTLFAEANLAELEDDEGLVDEAIKGEAFHFLRRCVVSSPHFHQEELCVQKMHTVLTSFIVNMHLKINELRNQGDEIARQMTLLQGNSERIAKGKRGFEEFMMLVGDLYSTDVNTLQLSLEFWSPVEAVHQPGLHYRAPQRQLSLFKFISTCSDLLPAPLFSSFMHMLTGLSDSPPAAHYSFNFLKANSPSLGGGGASAAISLDHFFNSLKQYYFGLRGDGMGRATPTGCAITPGELQGLQSVLRLIRTIARHDENARVVMYENQTWLPVASLFGLVGCSIPRVLKAEILETLSAFALSPEIAASMWHTLEIAQVLNTVPHSVDMMGDGQHGLSAHEGSIQVELEEIESQAEEYLLTRSFLSLLVPLINVPLPLSLGAGHRIPGLEPYLEFVRDKVFLKFDKRAYHNPDEKWEVASLALQVLYKLLSSYDFSERDFSDQFFEVSKDHKVPVVKSPGYSLLEHLMNNSKLLEKVLYVLDEACRLLSVPGQNYPDSLPHAALLCLKLLETALAREEQFFDLLRSYNRKVLVNPLHELLLEINPRTDKPDHMVTIAQYVCLTSCSPELALTAVQVLYWVSQSHKAARDLASYVTSDKDASVEIVRGFVEHLEQTEVGGQEPAEDSSIATVAEVHRALQLTILKLLSSCIDKPSPNIAHLLLGFETSSGQHVSDTLLQDPGVLGFRTCLHAILSLVEHGQDPNNLIGCFYSNPKLAELCYKVLYQLCASRDLCTPTLRYLRNNHDFFFSQLAWLPPRDGLGGGEETESEDQVSLLYQQSWLLRSVAVELRMTSLSNQRSHTQRIVSLLLSESNKESSESDAQMVADGGRNGGVQFKSDFDFVHEGRRKILVLLDLVNFTDKPSPELGQLDYPHLAAVEQMIGSCETKDVVSGLVYTDMEALQKQLLSAEELTANDIDQIHQFVLAKNKLASLSHVHCELFESWRQLVEVVLHTLTENTLKKELKIAVLFEIIQDLLLKVAHSEPSKLTASLQGVVLILISHLRQTVYTAEEDQDESILSSLYSGPLHGIMKGLIDNVLKAPASMQQVRAYLYGSLLYYLTMTGRKEQEEVKGFNLWQPDSDQNTVAAGNLSALNSFGEPFMDTVCKNACSGHDVTRMLSLSLLDTIVALDWQSAWLKFMSQKGYLQTLCASIQWEDDVLQKMLSPVPQALKTLYIYESKMAFLTRVATSPIGARELVSLNVLSYLTQCTFIDMRPANGAQPSAHMGYSFVPTTTDRYQQLFLPLLKFLLAILTCPGPQQKEACQQVTTLIGAHSDVFAAVLKAQLPVITMATLQELSLVTAVVAQSGVGHDWSNSASPFGSGLIRLQRLMLTLLPQFWTKQNWHTIVQAVVRDVERHSDGVEGGGGAEPVRTEQASLLVQQITSNVVAYCRVAMTMGGKEFTSIHRRCLLTPDLSEAISMSKVKDPFHPVGVNPTNPPSLGLLIHHLRECTDSYSVSLESYQQYHKKLDSPSNITAEDVRQLLPTSSTGEKLVFSQQKALARKRLKQLVLNKKQEMQLFAYIVENLLYILWSHLQYYLIYCKPVDPDSDLGIPGMSGLSGMRRMQGSTSYQSVPDSTFDLSSVGEGVKLSELNALKSDIGKSLKDGLFKKLLDLEEAQLQAKADMRVGFVQALVRRIRRLLKLKTKPE